MTEPLVKPEKTIVPITVTGEKIIPEYVLTPEELDRRKQVAGDFIRLLIDASEKGTTHLNSSLGRQDPVETGSTRLEFAHYTAVTMVDLIKQLGLTNQDMKGLAPDNEVWQHAVENPVQDTAGFTAT